MSLQWSSILSEKNLLPILLGQLKPKIESILFVPILQEPFSGLAASNKYLLEYHKNNTIMLLYYNQTTWMVEPKRT